MHILLCRYCRDFVKQMQSVAGLVRKQVGVPTAEEPHEELLNAFRKKFDKSSNDAQI
jgi:hypothetical protein